MRTRRWAVAFVIFSGAAITVLGCGKKTTTTEGSGQQSPTPAKAEEKGSASSPNDIPECAAHLKRVADCGEAESLLTKRRDEIQKRIDKGTNRGIMADACKNMDKVYKCKGEKGASASTDDPKAADPSKAEDKPASATSSTDELGVKVCDDYVKTVRSCSSMKSFKPLETLVEKWKKAIGEGKTKDVETACEKATKLFKCRA